MKKYTIEVLRSLGDWKEHVKFEFDINRGGWRLSPKVYKTKAEAIKAAKAYEKEYKEKGLSHIFRIKEVTE